MPNEYDGRQPFFFFLDNNGDGSGENNMAREPDVYYMKAPEDTYLLIYEAVITYQDNGGGRVTQYGRMNKLDNGIEVKIISHDGAVIRDMTAGVPIQQNGHWARFCEEHKRTDYGGGSDMWQSVWNFAKAGRPLALQPGQRLEFQVNDDLSALDDHYVQVRGINLRG